MQRVSWSSGAGRKAAAGSRRGARGTAKAPPTTTTRSPATTSTMATTTSTTSHPTTTTTTTMSPLPTTRQRLAAAAAAATLSFSSSLLFFCPLLSAHASSSTTLSASDVVVDSARLIPEGKRPALVARILALEEEKRGGGGGGGGGRNSNSTGSSSSTTSSSSSSYRVRLATRFLGDPAAPTDAELRAAWRPDPRTVVVIADPSSPNMLRILPGEATGEKLSRGFYLELAARYGNMFVRREDGGDVAALERAMDTLLACLESERGCDVVPGLSSDQRNLTTVFAAVAGFVAGFASRLKPSSFVTWKYGWLVVFSPLWGSLLVNFGLAPILLRTEDRLPLLLNLAVFAAGVVLFRASPLFAGEPGRDRDVLTKDGQRKIIESESESED